MKRLVVLAAALAVAGGAAAQSKKELVNKLLVLQQPGVENMVHGMVEQPAMQILQQAAPVLQNSVAADKRDAVAKDIQADAKKYVDETYPLVKDKGVKAAPSVLAPILEQKFSEDELKQLIAWLDSPVAKKYQQTLPEMMKALNDKMLTEIRPTIDPKAQALFQTVGKRLGVPPAGASAPAKK
ncbi:MAG: DUF2059 domain-containing protein [Leptothrix sp. (in: b-proteobacteria)]